MPKPSDDDKDHFRSLFEDRPELELKPMFGHIAAFVVANQQMCAGLFGPHVGLRLDEENRELLGSETGAGPFGPPDRPMKEYISMPLSWRSDPEQCEAWIETAIAYTSSLQPKKKRTKKVSKRP
jgi:TfoX/Sxy family transcriptional regulator of competence genes